MGTLSNVFEVFYSDDNPNRNAIRMIVMLKIIIKTVLKFCCGS